MTQRPASPADRSPARRVAAMLALYAAAMLVAPSDARATETRSTDATPAKRAADAQPKRQPAAQAKPAANRDAGRETKPDAQRSAKRDPKRDGKTAPNAEGRAVAKPAPTQAARAVAKPAPKPVAPDFGDRDDVRAFARDMAERHGFDEPALMAVFGRTRASETAIKLMTPAPPTFRRSWTAYRARFVEPFRIREGLRFWRENAATVRRASERFGVPEEILVSIIGVETIYGRNVGDFRVIDALSTLAFDYPRRAAYFREELEQYLLLAREAGFDPLDWRGSFAGAVGLPQFMPGSIRRHAVDFDGDGRIDLRGSPADAIGSVASFLANHGWTNGTATHFAATVDDEARAKPAVEAGIPPSLSMAELAELGVASPQAVPAAEKLSLIDLPRGDDTTHYVLGANNFWVITRYNRSYFYAMAVIDLAAALRDALPGSLARRAD